MSYKSYRADLNGFELISFVSSILWVFVFRKYTHGLLALICVFKAGAAVPAVLFFSSSEVKIRCVS